MRFRLRYIAAGLVLAASLALEFASLEPGTVPVAHAQRYRGQPDYRSPEPSGQSMGRGAMGVALFIVVALVLVFTDNTKGRATNDDEPEWAVDVTVLRVAVDGRERKFLQGQLDGITKSADARSGPG